MLINSFDDLKISFVLGRTAVLYESICICELFSVHWSCVNYPKLIVLNYLKLYSWFIFIVLKLSYILLTVVGCYCCIMNYDMVSTLVRILSRDI